MWIGANAIILLFAWIEQNRNSASAIKKLKEKRKRMLLGAFPTPLCVYCRQPEFGTNITVLALKFFAHPHSTPKVRILQ